VDRRKRGLVLMMRNKNWGICSLLALTLALWVFAPAAKADLAGTLYFTTFNGDISPNTTVNNVFSVNFSYTCAAGCGPGGTFVQGANTAIFKANGADGIAFYPTNSANLLIAGQDRNNVAQITTAGALVVNVKADTTNVDPQAFHMAITPDNAFLLTLPNQTGAGATSIDVLPLGATVAAGTSRTVTGADTALRGVDFCRSGLCSGAAYYTTANDNGLGDFGLLATPLTTPTTSLVTITNASNAGCTSTATGEGCLPAHGIVWDAFSGSFIIVSRNQVWQIQQTGATTWNVISKFTDTNTNDVFDQPSVDGNGHLFVADASTGNILFIDYTSGSHLIGAASDFVYEHFLANSLDDIVNNAGVPPPPVPEPASILLFGTAMAAAASVLRSRKA
jgi:hypothetical protein